MISRRAFIAGAVGAVARPLATEAQQAATVPKVGFLSASSPSVEGHRRKAFRGGLRDLGWIEGKNILVEERWAEGEYDRLPGLVAELVDLKVDVIVAAGPPVIRVAKQATSTIPIVTTHAIDPVGQGLIQSIQRPGGNITGMAWDPDPIITEKYLELTGGVFRRA